MREAHYWRNLPLDGEPFCDISAKSGLLDRVATGESLLWRDDGPLPTELEAFAVVLDLQGFTAFCDQRDPQNLVRPFVKAFHAWLFETLRGLLVDGSVAGPGLTHLHAPPPFFTKFLGDGYLLLWPADAAEIEKETADSISRDQADRDVEGDLTNLVSILFDIRNSYPAFADHLPYPEVPRRLRVGGAVGRIQRVDVGGAVDFVGPCINSAARLQKLGPLGFAIDTSGTPADFPDAPGLKVELCVKSVPVRGARTARVYVSVEEWEGLQDQEQRDVLGTSGG